VALLDRMIDVIVSRETTYDLIVFDTAPTGHTLQLLRMPEVMDTWIQALMKHRRAVLEIDQGHDAGGEPALTPADSASDPVLTALERRHERIKRLRRVVLDRARTSFVLVTIPERLAIEETARAAAILSATGIDVAALIVNRVLPDDVEGEFFRSRKAQESEYLQEIRRRFARTPRVDVRQLPRDVYGLAALEAISDQLL
jgi:arsenite-transporting ATPase